MTQYISPSDSRYWKSNPNRLEVPEGAVIGEAPEVNYGSDGRRTVSETDQRREDYYNSLYVTPEEQGQRNQTVKDDFNARMQEQIDAINSNYTNVYLQAAEEAQGRLGSTAAINALSGQRGSPSGAANREKTAQYNTEIKESIDARKGAEIAKIRGYYDEKRDEELRYQETLRRSNMKEWMEYMAGEDDREAERKKNRLDDILATNASFDELDDDLQQEYANLYGYSVNEAKRSWDHKIAQQLVDKEQAEKELARDDERYQWEKEDREKADIAVENELRAEGWEYIPNTDELSGIDKNQYDVVAIKQPGNRPDKLYKVPKGLSELEIYEMKKRIDAKYKGVSDQSSLNKDEEYPSGFWSAIKAGTASLQKGEKWGTVWDRIKMQFKEVGDEKIDKALGAEWREEGAFETWKQNQYKQTTNKWEIESLVWQWLSSEEAQNMSNTQKKQEIMANGFDPDDFGIY